MDVGTRDHPSLSFDGVYTERSERAQDRFALCHTAHWLLTAKREHCLLLTDREASHWLLITDDYILA
jgi:hypothetical protein